MTCKLRITLNGDAHEVAQLVTVADLLAQLDIDPRRVAVELNLIVLRRATFGTTLLKEGDAVEIVNFVGGGSGIKN
jgi:sulfur carrier protein